jgi:RNA polymerase sigma-54 factor
MAFELRQELKLSQQLVMTPQLQLAIKLLQMCRMELVDAIQQEITENPILEEVADSESESPEEGVENIEEIPDGKLEVLTDAQDNFTAEFKDYIENSRADSYARFAESEERESFESTLTKSSSLVDHLTWQLHMNALPDDEQKIGELIIGNINQDGYLQIPLLEIAKIFLIEKEQENPFSTVTRCTQLNWLTLLSALEKAGRVLRKIQEFDPLGVASRNLEECLLIQIRFLKQDESLAEKIVRMHLPDLERKKYQVIASNLKVKIEEVVEAANVISQLEPKPGRPFNDKEPQYITPDIHVFKTDNDYTVMLNGEGLPKLRLSPFYLQSIYSNSSSAPVKEYIKEKMRSAIWLIKSIYQRERTIRKVMESIIKFQRDFFDYGSDHLKPLVLKDVAEDIGMHESTISRVTTNKYVHTPHGIFELKYFFNAGVGAGRGGSGGEGISSVSVKNKIKQILSNEDPQHPYSDQEIVKILKEQNITIARRTVAKYREMLGILPSSKRKKFF